MKLLPIAAGTLAFVAGTPAAHADPPAVPCVADAPAECPPDALGGEPVDCVPELEVFPDLGFALDCESGEPLPLEDAYLLENRSDALPPPDPAAEPVVRSRPRPPRERPARVRVSTPAGTPPAGTPPARPGGDPTSIVQHPRVTKRTERGSVENNAGVGRGAMRGGPQAAGLPPGLWRKSGSARPVLPKIVPDPSASAPAGSRLTTEPLLAGRKSWVGIVGAAIVAEAGLLWLAVGLALRRRARARSKR